MKKLLFILLLGMFLVPTLNVEAVEFYDAEYIPNIYMVRERKGTKLYQQARFIRRTNDHQIAYCIEPFAFLDDRHNYQEPLNINDLEDETLRKISLISYYGYQYLHHQEEKWYAITQILIWKTANPDASFYFTDRLNGSAINPYEKEEKEILQLVQQADQTPSFDQLQQTLLVGDALTLKDEHQVLTYFFLTHDPGINVKIDNNFLLIDPIEEKGEYSILLTRSFNHYQTPPILYHSEINQDILTVGNPKNIQMSLKINVIPSEVIVKKKDANEEEKINKGDAILHDVIFGLYDINDQLLNQFTIKEDLTTKISNLPTGSYKIKELQAGIGYQLNQNEFSFELNALNPKIEITMENEIIMGKLILHKQYGKDDHWVDEANITFHIYNKKGTLVATDTTDINGYVSFILPYGEYTVIQENTSDGYQKIEEFTVMIEEHEQEYLFHLKDYQIDVPETGSYLPQLWIIETDDKKNYSSYFLHLN